MISTIKLYQDFRVAEEILKKKKYDLKRSAYRRLINLCLVVNIDIVFKYLPSVISQSLQKNAIFESVLALCSITQLTVAHHACAKPKVVDKENVRNTMLRGDLYAN